MKSRYDGLSVYNKIDDRNKIKPCLLIRFIDRSLQENKIHIVRNGENLMDIANRYYNDITLWYIIADKNTDVSDPFDLYDGQELFIPII